MERYGKIGRGKARQDSDRKIFHPLAQVYFSFSFFLFRFLVLKKNSILSMPFHHPEKYKLVIQRYCVIRRHVNKEITTFFKAIFVFFFLFCIFTMSEASRFFRIFFFLFSTPCLHFQSVDLFLYPTASCCSEKRGSGLYLLAFNPCFRILYYATAQLIYIYIYISV